MTRRCTTMKTDQTERRVASLSLSLLAYLALIVPSANAVHHMQLQPRHLVNRQNSDLPLVVTNNCDGTIYPAILTQSGTGPKKAGFRLNPGDSLPQSVSADWIGRVWGRTNCTFTDDGLVPQSSQGGSPCSSGDCGAFMECQGAVSCTTVIHQSITDMYRVIRQQHLQNSQCHPAATRPSMTSLSLMAITSQWASSLNLATTAS